MPTTTDTTYTWPTPTKQLLATYHQGAHLGRRRCPAPGPPVHHRGRRAARQAQRLDRMAGQPGHRRPQARRAPGARDAGLVQRVYPLPKHPEHPEAKSFGLYTGKATPAMSTLPRRQGAAPKAKAEAAVAAAQSNGGVARVEASALQVGDVIGTTRTDSRKTVETGGLVIGRITEGPGGRIQARQANGKMIRSFAPDTKVWRRRA